MTSLLFIKRVFQISLMSLILVAAVTVITVVALPTGPYIVDPDDGTLEPCRVSDITLVDSVEDKQKVTWTALDCAQSYTFTHYIDDEPHYPPTNPTEPTSMVIDRKECTRNKITITANVRDPLTHKPEPKELTFKNGIFGDAPVRDLKFNSETKRFEWSAPDVPERCDIKYLIKFTNGDPIVKSDTTTDEYYAPPIYPCTNNHITVTTWDGFTLSAAGSAPSDHKEPAPGDGKVKNLKFNKDNNRFEWNAPEGYERCQLKFRISFTKPIDNDETEDEFFEVNIDPCTTNDITVDTFIGFEERVGGRATATHIGGPPEKMEVRNLKFDGNKFVWQVPQYSEFCDVKYEVVLSNQADPSPVPVITPNTYHDFTVHPCSRNNIHVTTLIEDKKSDAVKAVHDGPVTRKPPVHISTNPQETGAKVRWRINVEENNFCEIKSLHFEITKAGEDEPPITPSISDDPNTDQLEYNLEELEPDIQYKYTVCQILVSSDEAACGDLVTFITQPLQDPEVSFPEPNPNGFRISLNDDNKNIVTKHVLSIIVVGPLHTLPEKCRETWYSEPITKTLQPNEPEFVFENGLPSFRYRIEVTTYFEDLGTSLKAEHEANTNEDVPNSLELHHWYDYTPGAPYDVRLNARLSIPCDINGIIKSYSLTLKGTLRDFESPCSDLDFHSATIDVDGESAEVEFNNIIEKLLPFFDYKLTITTSLQSPDHYDRKTENLDPVPIAHNAPSLTP